MTVELMAGFALCLVGGAILVTYLFQRSTNAKVARSRTIARAATEVGRCWRIIERVPNGFLTGSMRKLVGRLLDHTVSATLKLDPNNSFFREQADKTKQLLVGLGAEPSTSSRPVLTPQDRKEVATCLRDLRRLTTKAQDRGLLGAAETKKQQRDIDSLLTRIMVDHLKQNAFNSETSGHPDDAVGYIAKALETLSLANEGGRQGEEITSLRLDLGRMQELVKKEQERRRSSGTNRLLNAMEQNEAVKPAIALGAPRTQHR